MLLRINRLITQAHRTPQEGTGKPERLRSSWAGWWSRRIDPEHRLVDTVERDVIIIGQCRYHCWCGGQEVVFPVNDGRKLSGCRRPKTEQVSRPASAVGGQMIMADLASDVQEQGVGR